MAYQGLNIQTGQVLSLLVGDPATALPAIVMVSEGAVPTYSAAVTAFTPVAAPTDVLNIFGSNTRTVRVTRVRISGMTTSAVETVKDIVGVIRSTPGTLGTAVLTALTRVPHDSNDPAATAVISTVGTANYGATGALGTLVGNVRADKYTPGLATLTATDFPEPTVLEWNFTNNNEKGLVLRGTNQQFALNMNAIALVGTVTYDISVTWTEAPL